MWGQNSKLANLRDSRSLPRPVSAVRPHLAHIISAKQEKRYAVYRSKPSWHSNTACLRRGWLKLVPPRHVVGGTLVFDVDDVSVQLPGELKYEVIV